MTVINMFKKIVDRVSAENSTLRKKLKSLELEKAKNEIKNSMNVFNSTLDTADKKGLANSKIDPWEKMHAEEWRETRDRKYR